MTLSYSHIFGISLQFRYQRKTDIYPYTPTDQNEYTQGLHKSRLITSKMSRILLGHTKVACKACHHFHGDFPPLFGAKFASPLSFFVYGNVCMTRLGAKYASTFVP